LFQSTKVELKDKRLSKRSLSKHSLNTKKALNRVYTIELKNKKTKKKSRNKNKLMRRNSNALERSNGSLNRAKLVPKYKGCGPGGKHGSVMAINPN